MALALASVGDAIDGCRRISPQCASPAQQTGVLSRQVFLPASRHAPRGFERSRGLVTFRRHYLIALFIGQISAGDTRFRSMAAVERRSMSEASPLAITRHIATKAADHDYQRQREVLLLRHFTAGRAYLPEAQSPSCPRLSVTPSAAASSRRRRRSYARLRVVGVMPRLLDCLLRPRSAERPHAFTSATRSWQPRAPVIK